MAGGFHRFQLLNPLLDREFSLVVVIFSEEVAVFATQVAPVGYVDRTHGKLRQTKEEQFGHLAQLGQFSRNVHNARIMSSLFVILDRKSTRLNSSHSQISYAVFCLKKKNK